MSYKPLKLFRAGALQAPIPLWVGVIDYTPKHGSWLDIAEIELNVMTRQCMSRRIESIDILRSELSAWEVERNELQANVNWQFRTKDARIKLSSLYPEL